MFLMLCADAIFKAIEGLCKQRSKRAVTKLFISFRIVVVAWIFFLVLICFGSKLYAKPKIVNEKWVTEKLPKNAMILPKDPLTCWSYIQQAVQRKNRKTKRYPQTVKEAIQWLRTAERKGKLYWLHGRIMGHLQKQIDRHKKGNLHLLFGNNHTIVAHYRFFNELLHAGRDGISLDGLTHLAIEAFVTKPYGMPLKSSDFRWLKKTWSSSQRRFGMLRSSKARQRLGRLILSDHQPFLDLYTLKGKRWAFRLLKVISHFLLARAYPPTFLREVLNTLHHARKYRSKLRVIASDISLQIDRQVRRQACWIYPLRELYCLRAVKRSLVKTRNVIAYMWGADHVRKQHLPRFIAAHEKVFSVRLMGGGLPDIWDMALRELKITDRIFAIETPRAEAGDFLIHFPPDGAWVAGSAEIGAVSLARLSRRRKDPLQSHPPVVDLARYEQAVVGMLRLTRRNMARCYKGGPKQTLIQLKLAPSGRVMTVDLPVRHKKKNWSLPCLRKVLWKLPFTRTPKKQFLEILFRIRYLKFKQNQSEKQPSIRRKR